MDSIKENGLRLPGDLQVSRGILKAAISSNLRIVITLRVTTPPGSIAKLPEDAEIVKYHFIRDSRHDKTPGYASLNVTEVTCVQVVSNIGDALKLFGNTFTFDNFADAIFGGNKLTGDHSLYLEKIDIAVFPYDWYDCFEKNDPEDPRWVAIREILPRLDEIANSQQREAFARAERLKQEEDAKRRLALEAALKREEEERKKRDESRRKMQELQAALEQRIREENDPEEFVKAFERMLASEKKK